jgi:hypothetical protein
MPFLNSKVEVDLVAAGNALARAMGHNPQCKKAISPTKCDCGAGAQQAKALDEWLRLVKSFV